MSRFRTIQEMEQELKKDNCVVVALIGARETGENILPRDLKIAWGMDGIWDIQVNFDIGIKLPKGIKKVRASDA